MNTVDLFYKSLCILKIKVALIICRWSKVPSKAGENNGLIRPPSESVPGLDNREIAPISSPHRIGVEHQTTLASPFGSELVGVIWLTPCSGYDVGTIGHCDVTIAGGQQLYRWRHNRSTFWIIGSSDGIKCGFMSTGITLMIGAPNTRGQK